jgi:hypothetical protein
LRLEYFSVFVLSFVLVSVSLPGNMPLMSNGLPSKPSGSNNQIPDQELHASVDVHDDFAAEEDCISLPPDESASLGGVSSRVVLSSEQTKVLQMVQQGRNVFFTGSAGSLPLLWFKPQ